jgi:hypothetical protein
MPALPAPLAVAAAPPRLPLRVVGRAAIYLALILLPWLVVLAAGLFAISKVP